MLHTLLLSTLLLGAGATGVRGAPAVRSGGNVRFPASEIVASSGPPTEVAAVVAAIVSYWDRWLHLDTAGCTALLADDVTRNSQRAPHRQQGRARVVADLPLEWSAFERPGGIIHERERIRKAEIRVHGTSATALYWMQANGGARWSYDDLGLVFQAFEKGADGRWRIVHQVDSWSLDYDVDEGTPGTDTFSFDYVYPVDDLARATGFYRALLGPPEHVGRDGTVFNVKGQRFVLALSSEGSRVRPDLPNGHAVFHVPDVLAARRRLSAHGIRFVGGIRRLGADLALTALDPAGNVLVLQQRSFTSARRTVPVRVDGQPPPAVRAVVDPFMRADATSLRRALAADAVWFDDRVTRVRGLEKGSAAIARALPSVYWSHIDRDVSGLLATAAVTDLRVRPVGGARLFTYRLALVGTGPHPYEDHANVSQLVRGDRTEIMFISADHARDAMVLELDYAAAPFAKLAEAETFYTTVMRMGQPYRDEGWRGWWSDHAVYGAYRTVPSRDGIPVAGRSNGYMSFWVRSAEETFRLLQSRGCRFPVIEAITQHAGIDDEPGYRQLYATDSEGNGVVFTEYTGRRR